MRIAAGELEATFRPDVGMLGVSLRHAGEELLALPGGLRGYRAGRVTGLPLLAPWANRLGGWGYAIAGQDVDLRGLPLHTDEHGLPIHGTMTAQPGWQVIEQGPDRLSARFDYGARADLLAAFPFPHQLTVDAAIESGSLVVVTGLRPTGETPVPVSFGWHPYLRLPRSPRHSWRLRLPARRHLALDDRGLPTGGGTEEAAEREPLRERVFDDLYALGDDRCLAIEGAGRTISVQFDEGYPYAQVFAPAGQRFACLEPMTAPTNALVSGGCPMVEPGGTFVARFSVTPGRAG